MLKGKPGTREQTFNFGKAGDSKAAKREKVLPIGVGNVRQGGEAMPEETVAGLAAEKAAADEVFQFNARSLLLEAMNPLAEAGDLALQIGHLVLKLDQTGEGPSAAGQDMVVGVTGIVAAVELVAGLSGPETAHLDRRRMAFEAVPLAREAADELSFVVGEDRRGRVH